MDFRDAVAAKTDVIVTTLDQGISLAAEFDAHGFERLPRGGLHHGRMSILEIMNSYYTKMSDRTRNICPR